MARIARDTFDPLQSYISVRLQQGVPLVDADWNEAQDVRKFEVQAFLKWFVGNGVPEGNDGFHIAGLTSVDVNGVDMWDFVIQCGADAAPAGTSPVEQGLRHVGRCLVDGMDVIIAANINFRAQLLHDSKGRAASDLASLLGVPTIADVPVGNDPEEVYLVVVYLDVWERLVTPDEEPGLVHSGLGVESSARLKREWVVRARAGSSVPTPNDPIDPNNPDDPNRFIAGHSYYALAIIAYKGNDPITDEAITDQRERRLLMPPATLIEDLFGPVDYRDYRRGQGRPLVNLREAINTLLRGELPGSPEAPISTGANYLSFGHGTFFDAAHGLITTWQEQEEDLPVRLFVARLDLTMPEAGFRTIKEITVSSLPGCHATLLDTGEVLLVYATIGETSNILMQRGPFDTLPDAPVITVTDTAAREFDPFAVTVGKQVLILWNESPGNALRYRWYYPHDVDHPFRQVRTLSDGLLSGASQHAAVDSTNSKVWVAFSKNLPNPSLDPPRSEIWVIDVPLNPNQQPGQPQLLSLPDSFNSLPFVVMDNRDNVWVFWRQTNIGIRYSRLLRERRAWETDERTLVPEGGSLGGVGRATAVCDAEGGIWLVSSVTYHANAANIWFTRYNPTTQLWSEPRRISTLGRNDSQPLVLRGPEGSFWLFWLRASGLRYQPFFRRMFLSI